MPKVLLIEDDRETAHEITAELADRGFDVDWAATGIEGLDKARAANADAMIVDRLLPGIDGLTIIEVVRQECVRTPVLVLSALGAVDDRERGLRAGGDDYLTKPFAIVELVARLEALLRRPAEERHTMLRVGPLELDLLARTAKRGDRAIDLLPRESPARIYDASQRSVAHAGAVVRGGLKNSERSGLLEAPVRESSLGTGGAVQTRIEIIKIVSNEPGKQSEDQYGGDPSEDVGPPFPPVIDQQLFHGLPTLSY